MRGSKTSRFRMLALVAAAAAALSACSPTAAPSPTPTAAFASEDEAFAAAEETYRAYTDALNAQRSGDEAARPTEYLIGSALEDHLDSERDLAARNIRIVGDTRVQSFLGTGANIEGQSAQVVGVACINVADTKVVDESGTDITPAERPTITALTIELRSDDSELSISDSSLTEESPC